MAKKRVHLLSTVNAANVSKAGGTYTIREVCGAVDDIVMHGRLYPAEQLALAAPGLTGKPAPAGHPKNSDGRYISAVNGEALASAWIGSYCTNARHEGGRTLVDIVVNEKQARASDAGAALVERLDAAIAGTNTEPIHVSTGLFYRAINAAGESRGKKYQTVVTDIEYDHLAILVNARGAATPEEGVGMFLNADGQDEEVEEVAVNAEPEDRRTSRLLAWVKRLVSNGVDVSFDQISEGLYKLLPEYAWVREVFDRYCIWTDREGKLWKQDYAVGSDGSVAFSGDPMEVIRKVSYQPITNHQEADPMKDKILAALNAAGIKTEGLDETQLLDAYNALTRKPVEEKLTAANSQLAEHEKTAKAAEEAEVAKLATELAVNSALSVDDYKALGLKRLQELKAKAAPVVTGNSGTGGAANPYADYDPNKSLQPKEAA